MRHRTSSRVQKYPYIQEVRGDGTGSRHHTWDFFLPLVYIMYCSFFLAMFIRFIDHFFINIHSAMQEILYGGVQCIH